MKFMYFNARLPKDCKLLQHIHSATNILYNKLRLLDVHSLKISDYKKRYLIDHLKNLRGILFKYSFILS